MTGTAATEAAELMNTYGLAVVPIPTNQTVIRDDQADLIYKSELSKFGAVVDDIAEKYDRGQPVLVGTISVEKSEYLSQLLKKRGVPHEVLNAKQHTREAMIVTQAGRLNSVTVATNMAGRGVDIILGGNPEGLARHEVVKEGHDPDVLVDDFALPLPIDQMPDEFKAARTAALARYDQLLAKFKEDCKAEGDKVRALGGLYVLGTERHESRRIDNQLRGRSGRQGDPGESRFYLSLDDELMRLFATGALSWVMGRALPDDEAIEAKMVTKAIERAQTTVEQRNAEIRKNVLKYDEVMNEQRKVIYRRRDQILEGVDLKTAAMEYLAEAVDSLIETHCVSVANDEWDLDGLVMELKTFWPNDIAAEQLEKCHETDEMYDIVMADASAYYEKREAELGSPVMRDVERQVMLRIIDQRWREHLEEMDYLQEGINLRAMGQKDPLVEWQREGYEMFGSLMKGIAQDFVKYVMHVQVIRNDVPAPIVQNVQQTSSENVQPDGFAAAARAAAASGDPDVAAAPAAAAPVKQQTIVKDEWSKTPRNAPCPCGSGKKFKMCHGRARNRVVAVMRDFSDDLKELRRRLGEAEGYLKIDSNRARLIELEHEVARPDLWDDQDLAKKINTEYANVKTDIEQFDLLAGQLEDAEVLHEMAREVDDASQEPELDEAIASITSQLDQLDLRSLFTGEHDEADCIVQINAKDGGVDAQDWTEILLRMYGRWAERRGFGFEIDGISEGAEAGIMSAEFTITGRYAYGLMTSRARDAPAGADQPVRQPGSPADELRRGAGVAGDGRPGSRGQRRRHSHGGVPGQWCRRTARQQDVVRGAPDPRADRAGGLVAGGAQPAAEPGEGDEPTAHDDRREDRRRARGRARQHRRPAGAGRLGQSDPLVRRAALPDGERPAHRGRIEQDRGGARRRHRRVHGGLPAVATAGGGVNPLVFAELWAGRRLQACVEKPR